jgi:heme exporter protein A
LQQRVSIARALVHDPRIVLLDEPYTGLDDIGARALTTALLELRAQGAAMVLVTHHLGEGLSMATKAMVMVSGRVAHTEHAETTPIDIDAFTTRYRELVAGGVA